MKVKKSTAIIAVVLMLVLTAVVGCYAFLSGRAKEKEKEAELTAVQLVLSKDLDRDYPATPKAVIRYYTEIEKCFYNETCTDEELEQLGMKARQLYDEDLLANNEVGTYLTRLKVEIEEFKKAGKKMTGANVAASANVDTFTEDGYDFARIYCGYTILDGNGSTNVAQVYLLRRDENRKWKIYGWQSADKVNPGEENK